MKFLLAIRLGARFGLTLLLASQVLAAPGLATWEMARVTRVIDGDTYEVLTGSQVLRVRLLGVDAPEHDQAFGPQATDSATALLRGRLVRLQCHGTDLYGRTLGQLRLAGNGAGAAVDSLLVVRGWAWAFDPSHVAAERLPQQLAAQRAGRGLWKCGVDGTLPPKAWRGFTAKIKRRYGVGCTW
ncbi:thermonuclease family protein [Hymenobacter sp. BRD128]|uniref:thermonuclease family protein n=1 Tax=Hymenobacter sp. BRD128 TaxID=2675878 RepID=UPI001565E927|nr:thermonuclease family protein [Hymenobacter sp. BRD128]QKG58779.1 thermonuclease family protein [Hymenobacter sp. BRD128]